MFGANERVFSYNVAELFSKFAAASLLNTLISPFNYCDGKTRAKEGWREFCMKGCRWMKILKIINLRNKIENSFKKTSFVYIFFFLQHKSVEGSRIFFSSTTFQFPTMM
jgi:hypothetical protein